MNILLRSAKIIDKNSKYHNKKMDILIKNGMISEIGKTLKGPKNCREITLKNLHVSIGWFDSSVSLGEPGYEERENIVHGLEVAAKSGFTKVAVNPNTNPFIDNKSSVEFLIQKAKDSAVDLHPIANLTQGAMGKEMAELYDMKNSGAIAFGDYNKSIENANLLKIALLYVQNFDGIVLSFPQDGGIGKHGFVNESENTTRLGLNSIPNLSEELQITRDLSLLEYTGGKLHIPTITTHKGVQLVKEAKKKGLDVTCSVAAHHLYLTDEEISSFDTNYKVNPPLRAVKDTKALIKGIKEGVVDMIVSDHNPIDIENKNVEFENGYFGTIGMESLFGSIGSKMNLEDAIDCITENPRKRFNLPVGIIEEDHKAELTLFDPEHDYIFEEKNILSKSKNSAFLGKQLKGKAYGIIANKQLILS
ncbi:dihydroorotase [Lutimonas zeaxanthinifaciens]|uniref:dihydroorotase n=1 Tax=Lutimonas zeaxanthinifaciens TaxID=3060215 RepID=UPI00265D539E|nr:dihydroorotase [Lutimonas sp. YSD2104]WKK64837.1 dihydroorotase [Lutimonas sp. YSD2104]